MPQQMFPILGYRHPRSLGCWQRCLGDQLRDKKSAAGRIKFVAVEAIGRTKLIELTVSEIVQHL